MRGASSLAGLRRVALTRTTIAVLLGAVALAVSGCYVVPAPPPLANAIPPPPPHVVATPQCRWVYGSGWYGWGWYGSLC